MLPQDPQQYNSAAMARKIDGAIKQCMSLSSQVQVRQQQQQHYAHSHLPFVSHTYFSIWCSCHAVPHCCVRLCAHLQ